ncbi:CapA family protein [Labilibacter marinus]|uniref:CapA family protein n=1 Tax=Labilibacter marinus TaxID=1477105 RepID=UPI00094F8327|nr:CapA family protein [Labilibacter marinus]
MRLLFILTLSLFAGLSVVQAQNDTLISFIGVGDMMLGTDFPKKEYLPPNNDPLPYVSEAIPYLKSGDVTFGNLETCLLDEGPVVKRCKDTTKCYAFKMPEKYGLTLKEMGFDFLNMANNHIRDFGQLGMTTTRYHLDKMNIAWAGLLDKPTDTITAKGLKIGMAGFSPNTGTVDINDLPNAIRIVKHLKDSCDIVIVSFHGGAEGAKHQHVTREKEVFYGENRSNVYEFAHAMIDAGADIIFGHGPHVTRAMEIYNNRFIIYSMGNFATYSRFNLTGPNALTPIIKVYTTRSGEFVKGEIIPFKQIKNVALTYDHSHGVIHKIKDLTRIDFPELNHRLIIEPDGKFSMPFERKMQPKGIGLNGQQSIANSRELVGF